MTMALEGIKILDLSRTPPVPFCTMILGDLGAEIIKIDIPSGASRLRTRAPSARQKRNALYQASARNKKSIGLNLQSEEARQIVYQMAEKADIVIEGFRPGVVKRLGVDYETISKINPRIIYCSISSYGQDGPYRDVIAHDLNSISMGGALDLIGQKGGRPIIPLNLLADFGGSGMCAAIGILSALIARNKTGKGQYIDISLLDSVILLLSSLASGYFSSNIVPKRGEQILSGGDYPCYNIYDTKDGKLISIACLEPYIWADFCREIGKEEFIPYQINPKKWEEVSSYLKQLFLTKTRDEWFDLMSQKNIFISKVYSLDEVFTDPQVRHREMVLEVEHPTEGKVKQVGIAIKLSDTPGKIRTLASLPGEHTNEILIGLGYSEQRISELRQAGAIS